MLAAFISSSPVKSKGEPVSISHLRMERNSGEAERERDPAGLESSPVIRECNDDDGLTFFGRALVGKLSKAA